MPCNTTSSWSIPCANIKYRKLELTFCNHSVANEHLLHVRSILQYLYQVDSQKSMSLSTTDVSTSSTIGLLSDVCSVTFSSDKALMALGV